MAVNCAGREPKTDRTIHLSLKLIQLIGIIILTHIHKKASTHFLNAHSSPSLTQTSVVKLCAVDTISFHFPVFHSLAVMNMTCVTVQCSRSSYRSRNEIHIYGGGNGWLPDGQYSTELSLLHKLKCTHQTC